MYVVTGPLVNSFKDRIITGHHKNLDTIGKQNYQEPGVEPELNFEFLNFLPYLLNSNMGKEALTFRP